MNDFCLIFHNEPELRAYTERKIVHEFVGRSNLTRGRVIGFYSGFCLARGWEADTESELLWAALPAPNDVEWRDFSDENIRLLEENPHLKVLVLTSVCHRLSWASRIQYEQGGFQLIDARERALKFAFFS